MDPSPALREFEALVRERVEPIVRGAALGWNESGLHEGTWGRQAVGMGPDGEIEIHPPDESVISALFEGDAEEFKGASRPRGRRGGDRLRGSLDQVFPQEGTDRGTA